MKYTAIDGMDWLSKLLGKNKNKSSGIKQIDIAELELLVDAKLQNTTNQFNDEIDNFYSQIQHGVNRMQDKLKLLENAKPLEKVDFGLLNVASSHRKNFTNLFNIMLKEFKKPINLDFISFIDFHNSCVLALNETNVKSEKSFHVIGEVFEQEGDAILMEYKSMHRLLEGIGQSLKNKKDVVDPLYNIQNLIKSMISTKNEMALKDTEIKNIKSVVESLKHRRELVKNKIRDMTSSNESKLVNEIVKDKEQIDKEIKNIEERIVHLSVTFERGLKKLKKLVEEGAEDLDKNYINLYLTNPVYALLSDENQIVIKSLLNSIEKMILGNKISFGSNEGKGLMKVVEDIKANDKLKKLSDELRYLNARKNELNVEYEKFVANEKTLESELDDINDEINEIESNVEVLSKTKDEMYENLNNIKLELEKSQDVLGQEFSIK